MKPEQALTQGVKVHSEESYGVLDLLAAAAVQQ